MYPRRLIIDPNSHVHVTSRCHNRNFFLADDRVKKKLLLLLGHNKKKYSIKIYDFIIMDNHYHLNVFTKDAESLGNFMRTVGSQIGRFINKVYNRDSQAIKERYGSAMITSPTYMKNTIQYIWMNRYKVNKSCNPKTDLFCSAAWRYNPNLFQCLLDKDYKQADYDALANLLDPIEETGVFPQSLGPILRQIENLISEAKSKITDLCPRIYENSHTIGSDDVVRYRGNYLHSFSKGILAFERLV